MKSAIGILGELMPDMDPDVIHAFCDRIAKSGRDPMIYAEAFVIKAKSLDKGPDGFFFVMVRDGKEDDWLKGPLKKVGKRIEKRVTENWPYPRGKTACKKCCGRGWYAVRRNDLDGVHEEMLQNHRMDGFEEVVMVHPVLDTERVVYICPECNPGGERETRFTGKEYRRYPVGGAPYKVTGILAETEID